MLANSLREVGFSIRDCARRRGGGVCLTTSARENGVVVTWTSCETLARDPQRYHQQQDVLTVMNYALGEVMIGLGYDVRECGSAGANIVLGQRPTTPVDPEPVDVANGSTPAPAAGRST